MRKLILFTILILLTLNVSSIASAKEPLTRTIVSSPPIVYSDTLDLGTFHPVDKPINGLCIENIGSKTLELDRIVCSDPNLKCKILLNRVTPGMMVSAIISSKFKEPKGKINAKVQVYWKGIDKPTEFYLIGNCIK